MREQTITDLSEVQDGDICTVEIEGLRYTGPAYGYVGNALKWGGHTLRHNGDARPFVTFISATRTTPRLPTEPGSAILIHEALGETFDPPMLAVRNGGDPFSWSVARKIGFVLWLDEEQITRWQECDITPRGEIIEQ